MRCGYLVLLTMPAALLAQFVPPQEIRTGPVNAASYMPAEWAGSGIAQGALFVLKGAVLGPTPLVVADSFPLRTELGGTSITVTIGGRTIRPYIVYAGYFQVAALLPSNTPVGNGSLTLSYDGKTTEPTTIRVVPNSFGIFTRNEGGTGPGIVQNVKSETDRPVNALNVVARPNQTVILWGTGLGRVDGAEEAQPLPGDLDVTLDVFVGGRPAKLLYKGRSGCCAGIDQIVFEVPSDVEGCYVPVAVRVNGQVSNFVTMSIASQGTVCADLPGLTGSEVAKLERGESLNLARIELLRVTESVSLAGLNATVTMDLGIGTFTRYRPFELLRSTSAASFWRAGVPSPGGCLVLPANSHLDLPLPAYEDPYDPYSIRLTLLDSGSKLNLSGPSGSKPLSLSNSAYSGFLGGVDPYGRMAPLYLEPGSYTIDNGDGGKDVGAFKAAVTVPEPLVWLNQDGISEISRTQDLTLSWRSAAPAKELVTAIAVSSPQRGVGTVLLCSDRAAAGQMTIPAWVLSALTPSGISNGLPMGGLGVMNSPLDSDGIFHAPGIDVGVLQYLQMTGKLLAIR